jgi:hypothetical protein
MQLWTGTCGARPACNWHGPPPTANYLGAHYEYNYYHG